MRPSVLMVLATTCLLSPLNSESARAFHLEHSNDDFGVRLHGILETIAPGRTKFYPLPQSTAQQYIRLRPKDFRLNPFKPNEYERQEVIGPHQVEDGRIWFGKDFYDSEGTRGVGAFGYFDTSDRKYVLYSPPAIACCEVSAILVQPDVVWIALDHFVEDISRFPGGLIRWDRNTQEVRRFPIEFVVTRFKVQSDGSLRLSTRGGYALVRGEEVQRYLSNGRPIKKFPLPPSKY